MRFRVAQPLRAPLQAPHRHDDAAIPQWASSWEELYNPTFNPLGFEGFRKEVGLNSFTISPSKWIAGVNAVGIKAQAGRYGGTYARSDIAVMINDGVPQSVRLRKLNEIAIQQMRILEDVGGRRLLK